ncbi:hypothetical protein LOTGIDRAFT_152117 [Lottia gigantea]|uniref:Chitin-binding type-2 domain-containing protein n=1 Tax=Lottia gigantea TaxID=225164 RepID=V4BH60_LOTGI|nr:hypothetical protein LOTGIDRAFT_152117 [Lottia gigantea]ESP05287.1 hypothetical protein LOTGIDRAFT_152117 [Lottia gigantea]
MNLILVTICAILLTQVNAGDISGSVTCDNILKFFVDGQLEASSNDWQVASPVSFSDTAHVLAFDCLDEGVIAGIRGSFSNGVVTDSSWRCSTSADEGWKEIGFDDSNWQDATIQTHTNWGANPTSIPSEAKWIWTAGDTADTHVFCRLRLHPATCVPGNLNTSHVMDPNDCKRFWQCVHGTYVSMPCAPGTGFHEGQQRCEHLYLLPNCN